VANINPSIIDRDRWISMIKFDFDGLEIAYLDRNRQGDYISLASFVTLMAPRGDEEFDVLFERLQETASRMVEKAFELEEYGPRPDYDDEGGAAWEDIPLPSTKED